MKVLFRGAYFRISITLMALASSALVMEAGHRWH